MFYNISRGYSMTPFTDIFTVFIVKPFISLLKYIVYVWSDVLVALVKASRHGRQSENLHKIMVVVIGAAVV